MTNSKRSRKNISKEIMFNKIMPSYSSTSYNDYYGSNSSGGDGRNPKSEPDPFKIRENVLMAMEKKERPLVQEQMHQPQQNQNPYQQNTQYSSDPYQQQNAAYRQSYPDYQQPQGQPGMPISGNQIPYGQPAVQYQQQYIPDPAFTEDKPKYINITEEVLYSKLSNMIAMFKCCSCEKCRQTIMLHVLNNVKPEYVYKKPSEVKELIESNNYVDINQPIIRAILDTKSNPPHKK